MEEKPAYYLQSKVGLSVPDWLVDHESDGGLWEGVWVDRHLHAALPLLLPWVPDAPVVVRAKGFIVRQLHSRDQVLAEQLHGQSIKLGHVLNFIYALYVCFQNSLPSSGSVTV